MVLVMMDFLGLNFNLFEVGSAFMNSFSKNDLVEGGRCSFLIAGQSSMFGTFKGVSCKCGGLNSESLVLKVLDLGVEDFSSNSILFLDQVWFKDRRNIRE